MAHTIAVFKEISADSLTPIGIVQALATEMENGAILESGRQHPENGRYSYIAFNPCLNVHVKNSITYSSHKNKKTIHHAHPFTVLRKLIAEQSAMNDMVGFVNYGDLSEQPYPDMVFNSYQTAMIFDHFSHSLKITVIAESEAAGHLELESLIKKITAPVQHTKKATPKADHPVEIDMTDGEYIHLVEQAKKHIKAGDAFQIVLSRSFKKKYTVSPFDIYRTLRRVSPAPYMFYLPYEDSVMIGASPEKLITVRDKKIHINPIAGTRPRRDETDEERITTELLQDKKECAEHIMLVDLARNDLGVVCKPGSIHVDELLNVKHFSHVSHIASTISGELREDKDSLDALCAAFPAGTLSGAPKIRAMQIIDELEISPRGIYGGIICRLDQQLNLDSCIAIRMAVLKDGIATIRTGAGIVYDSDPQSEANETHQKAKGMLDTLTLAQEIMS